MLTHCTKRRRQKMRKALSIIVLLLLTACGAAAPSGEPAGGQADTSPTAPASTNSAPAVVTAPPPAVTAPPAAVPLPAGSVEAKAVDILGKKVGVDAAKLSLVSKEATEWSDSGLGCRAEGMMYLQVITPGYKLTFTDGSKTYEVHSDESGSRAVWCDNGKPVSLEQTGS
jgi:hypothetical protein